MRACPNCRSEFGVSDVFCTNCGTRQDPLANQGSPERAGVRDAQRQPARGVVTAPAAEKPPGQPHWTQEPNFASMPSGVPAPSTAPIRAAETLEQKYLRHTRNATVFIAIIVGIVTVLTLVGVIWTATNISKLNSEINGVNNISNCESLGGTNSSC
jgi:cobalamin biosynthesis Mg chelatase CobN